MSFLKEPLSRLKWGFIPVRRIVDEHEDNDSSQPDSTEQGSKDSFHDSVHERTRETGEVEVLEYRDEATRPWWKFFDEYEYRLNKQTRSNHKWYSWFDPNDTPAERKLMWKIDILLTFYSLMAYWVKYLDQTNLNNAYVAGLKESLHMKHDDFVHTQVMFSIGSIVFQLPFMYVLNGLPLNYVMPILDICWSILTIGIAGVSTLPQLKALRFLIGVFEAPAYLAYQFLFGSFIFNPAMIVRRSMVYYFGMYLGILSSGFLSGTIVRTCQGVAGLQAWQWIFIIDGALSIVVGLIGFYMLPGTPADCYSIWLTDDEIRLLRKRLKQNNTSGRPQVDIFKSILSLDTWRRILSSWEIYVVVFWNVLCWNNATGPSGAWSAIWISQAFNFTGNVILAVWNVPEQAKWFAWSLQFFSAAMIPVLYSWQNDICRRDAEKRAVVLVAMNTLASASTAWMSVIVFKTSEAPRFLKGYSFAATSAFGVSLWTLVVLYFYKKEERKYARENGIVLYNSLTDPEPVHELEATSSDGEKKGSNSVVVEESSKGL
ncbi:hypothetical protein JCM33374_g1760 [Metschnikowia sp. JCM 33374]|nr:hypothetical protein JCM33374_g1760 [Metschnikowia sp. JCM 33374]